MPSSRSRLLLCCFSISFFAMHFCPHRRSLLANEEQTGIDKFNQLYTKSAPRVAEFYGQLRGTCRINRQTSPNSDKYKIDDITFSVDHGISKAELLQARNPGEKGDRPVYVYCIASDFAYTLVRNSVEKTFDVRSLGKDRTDRSSFANNLGRYLFAPYMILGHRSLSDLMLFEGFEIVSANELKPDHFELKYRVGTPASKDEVKLVLDPTNSWLIKSGTITPAALGGKVKIDYQIEYQDNGPIPLPKRVKYHDVTGLDTICEFTSISSEPTDPKEFMMSYYGLPEMTGPGRNAKSDRIPVLASLAFLSAILGIILRYRANRSLADPT